jgi:hypothetical protein
MVIHRDHCSFIKGAYFERQGVSRRLETLMLTLIKRQMPITSQPITAYRLQNQKPYKPRQCGIFNQGISLSSILIQVSIMAKIRPEKKIFPQNSAG